MGQTSPIQGGVAVSKLKKRILLAAAVTALLFTGTAATQHAAHHHLPFYRDAVCSPLSLFVREERLPEGQFHPLPRLEDGDILVTRCTHSFGWRHGHAALVVDAGAGRTLEAITLGIPSGYGSVQSWRTYPSFSVLRLKGTGAEFRREVARYAQAHLHALPYRLTSGLFREKAPSPPSGSQCAYLVWYAYHQFGYDLDSDGGRLVTVADLIQSPLLETVARIGEPQNM